MTDDNKLIPDEPDMENKGKKVEYDAELLKYSTVFGAAAETKKRKLTPTVKGLLFSGIALLVAGAVLTTVLLLPKKSDQAPSASVKPTPVYTVTSLKEADIDTVEVYNGKHPEGFKLHKKEGDTVSSATSSGNATFEWQVEGFEKYDLISTKYLVQTASALSSSKKYTSPSALTADDIELDAVNFGEKKIENDDDIYGFLNPDSVLVLKGKDWEKRIIVGNEAPDKSGRYVSVTEDENVYVISESSMAYFNSSYTEMVGMLVNDYILQTEGTADYYSEGALAKIDKAVLGGSCRKNKVRIESPPDDLSVIPFVVTEPVFRAGDEESISKIMDVASVGLSNDGAYQLGYTKADLVKFGLDKPFSTLEIVIGSYRVYLSFGTLQEDGYYPCIKEGSDIIYKVSAEENEWITYTDKDVYYDTLFLEYISGISSIGVKTANKEALFELVRENPEEKSTYTIKCDQAKKGVVIDSKQVNFYYSRILSLATEEFTDAPAPTGDADLTITINYTDKSRKADVIKLYKHSTRRYFYTLNGEGNSLVSSTSVKDLISCLDKLLKGEEIGRK